MDFSIDGLDKDLMQPVGGYWGFNLLPDVTTVQPLSSDTVAASVNNGMVAPSIISQPVNQVATSSTSSDTISAIGKAAGDVINALKRNQQTAANNEANNTPAPTPDNGKKTTTILWVVVGLVAVLTLLYFALKPHK